MAINYPTDIYIFAVVLTSHKKSAPKDPAIAREAQERIPWFVATHEADSTLKNVLKLEQKIGKEIKWVASPWTLDDYIFKTTDEPGYRLGDSFLPTKFRRFCTVETKIQPIQRYLYANHYNGNPFLMNIGYRWDEQKRVEGWTCANEKAKIPISASISSKRRSYKKIDFRITRFPLYEDRIDRQEVHRYWEKEGWEFPMISNCRFCFHHTQNQLTIQAKMEPDNAEWWLNMEKMTGKTFGETSLQKILSQQVLEIFPSSSCFCSD